MAQQEAMLVTEQQLKNNEIINEIKNALEFRIYQDTPPYKEDGILEFNLDSSPTASHINIEVIRHDNIEDKNSFIIMSELQIVTGENYKKTVAHYRDLYGAIFHPKNTNFLRNSFKLTIDKKLIIPGVYKLGGAFFYSFPGTQDMMVWSQYIKFIVNGSNYRYPMWRDVKTKIERNSRINFENINSENELYMSKNIYTCTDIERKIIENIKTHIENKKKDINLSQNIGAHKSSIKETNISHRKPTIIPKVDMFFFSTSDIKIAINPKYEDPLGYSIIHSPDELRFMIINNGKYDIIVIDLIIIALINKDTNENIKRNSQGIVINLKVKKTDRNIHRLGPVYKLQKYLFKYNGSYVVNILVQPIDKNGKNIGPKAEYARKFEVKMYSDIIERKI